MTQFNNYPVVKRCDNPSPISPTLLEFFFLNDGAYQNPYQVCSVHIFKDTTKGVGNKYLDLSAGSDTYGQVSSTDYSYRFSNWTTGPDGVAYWDVSSQKSPIDYIPYLPDSASGIFKVSDGYFAVILQPGASGVDKAGEELIANSASAVGEYLDIWTIMDVIGSFTRTYVNTFSLTSKGVIATTSPVEITPSNKLVNRYINIGSREPLKVKTNFTLENSSVPEAIRNMFQQGSVLNNAMMKIVKINETPELASRVVVQDFSDTSGGVSVDCNNNISFLWDTANIQPASLEDNLGGTTGVYEVQVRYNLLETLHYSPKFKLIVQ
jgi:hypothetical protein